MNKEIVLLAVCFVFFAVPFSAGAFSLGVVSDIHAGGARDLVRSEENTIYPRNYCQNLEGVKNAEVDYILTLGDNTLNGRPSEAERVTSCMKGLNNVLWTKGNHDKEAAWKYFGTPNYYSKKIGNWKIIVLDSSKRVPSTSGGFWDEQLTWLENELEQSVRDDEKIFIAMHHSVFRMTPLFPNIAYKDDALRQLFPPVEMELPHPIYKNFLNMVEASGKVKYIYSGHIHRSNRCLPINDINFCSVPALSLIGNEGYFAKLFLE